jgi:hypothetical protein
MFFMTCSSNASLLLSQTDGGRYDMTRLIYHFRSLDCVARNKFLEAFQLIGSRKLNNNFEDNR